MSFYVANEEDGATVAGLYPFVPAFHSFKERIGVGFESYVELTAGHMKWWTNEAEYERAAKRIFERILVDAAFFPLVKRKTIALSDAMRSFSRELLEKELGTASTTSTSELISLMRKQSAQIAELLSWAMLITVIEIPHELVSKKLLEIVTEKTKTQAGGGKTLLVPVDCAAVLSTPLEENNAKLEFKELVEIACEIDANGRAKQALLENKNDKNNAASAFSALGKAAPELAQKIGAHARKFGWVYYGYAGPAWTANEFAREIAALLEDKNPRQAKTEMQARDAALARKQKEFEAALGLSAEEKRIAGIARDVMFLKAYRKEAMFYSYYAVERVQNEFGKRCGLGLRQVRWLYPHEFEKAAQREIKAPLLDSRFKHCVFGVQNEINGKREIVFFDDADAEKQSRKFAEKAVGDVKEVRGACAQPGFAAGVVRVVNKPEDVKKMLKGDVLVSIATTPDLVTAMRKASAIVTDIGGLTCHAEIVSRELGIPCVVGTRIATKVFRDGDSVEVDASNGIVRKTA
ncbi:MAG: PEP-utilizing enzyme [Candidatus Micrarchaeota archaeon]